MQKPPIVFWELATQNMEKSTAFFKTVFDWEIEFDGQLGFNIIPETTSDNESIDGGIFTLKRAKLPFLALYIQVEDIYAKVELIKQQGGLIVDEPSETPGGAKICMFMNPLGSHSRCLNKNDSRIK